MTPISIALKIIISAVCSGLIGLERELHGCAAGLRTHILVAIGSTLFMITSLEVAAGYSGLGAVDPSRIAAGVVTGVGFLGAGAIIRYGTSIRGLTTAASIWAVAAIGLAIGTGGYMPAGITTALALIVLILSRIEELFVMKSRGKELFIELDTAKGTSISDIDQVIGSHNGRIKRTTHRMEGHTDMCGVTYEIIVSRFYYNPIMDEISSLPGVVRVKWL